MRLDPAAKRVGERPALSLSAGRDRFLALGRVQEALARWAAPLPRTRQPDDAQRRAAVAIACALSELALEADAARHWEAGDRGVVEDATALGERSGLTRQQVDGAIGMLVAAICVERITAGGERRLRLLPELLAEDPSLARIAWPAARGRLRAVRASVLPAQAVLRALARQSGAVPPNGAAPVIVCTQESLATETLLGRTAVVSALRALCEAGLIERAARRGTWTECRLLPAAFGADQRGGGHVLAVIGDQEVPLARIPDRAEPDRAEAVRAAAPAVSGTAGGQPAPTAAAAMMLKVGGVRVPLTVGTTVEPPPGATIRIEVDAAGRSFVCLGPGIRLGPLV